MMKRLLLLGAILLTLVALNSSVADATLFSCDNEFCTFNGTTNKWYCHYEGCPNQPEWVQNITQINTSVVNVTNCSIEDLYEYWDYYIARIDKRFNYTEEISERDASLNTCMNELDFCNSKQAVQENCINQVVFDNIKEQLDQKTKELDDEQGGSWYKFLGGLVIGVGAMYFLNQRSQPKKSDVEPTQGEHAFRPSAIDHDSKIAQQQQQIDELQKQLQDVANKGKK